MANPSQLPQIDTLRCTGCGWCVAGCPPHVMSFQRDGWRKHVVLHDLYGCTGCSKCERKCPFGVITMNRTVALVRRPMPG